MSELAGEALEAGICVEREVRRLLAQRRPPIVVAIDGGSGSGKSTLAALLNDRLGAAVIPLDDFFSVDIPDSRWDGFSVEERRERVFDWRRLRKRVIEPLLDGRAARWRPIDFVSGLRADGTYRLQDETVEVQPADVILIEGAYSAGPELADVVDLSVLVDVPIGRRHARLEAREEARFLERWHRRWDPVEAYYFREVRPRCAFDLVVGSDA